LILTDEGVFGTGKDFHERGGVEVAEHGDDRQAADKFGDEAVANQVLRLDLAEQTKIALCLLFIGKTLIRVRAGTSSLGLGNLFRREDISSGRAGLFALTVADVWFIDWGGFTLTTFVFLVAAMALLTRGRRLGVITLVSAVMALGGWVLFIWLFDTRFPRGPFEDMMRVLLDG